MDARTPELPESFRNHIILHYGDEGRRWLRKLSGLLDECEELWDVRIGRTPVPNLSWNYIAPARTRDGRDLIVKVGPPEKEVRTEMQTLELFSGNGMVALLERDAERYAMLLERLDPGASLREIQREDDAQATRLAAPLMRDLSAPVPSDHSFPHVADWADVLCRVRPVLEAGEGRLTLRMVEKAQRILAELEATKAGDRLIHGDLHHDNILFDEKRGWTAIDPKGLIGDHAYNAARFMNNWWDSTPQTEIIENRLALFADIAGFPRERIVGWAYVDCIIGNSWEVEEGHPEELSDTFSTYVELLDPFVDSAF